MSEYPSRFPRWPPHRVPAEPAPSADDPADLPSDASGTRDALAQHRDQVGRARDVEAALRDDLAEAADKQIEGVERDAGLENRPPLTGHRIVFRAARDRERAAADRGAAAQQRAASARDREGAARDRRLAAADRQSAEAERAAAGVDELTGALRRGVGLTALAREVARSHRTKEPLVLAFVDIDGLKPVNDIHGHSAGDDLLQRTVEVIKTQLRPYDITVRVGGDEFVCALCGVSADGARKRFAQVAADLAAGPRGGSVSVGFSELRPDDSLDDLVARADADLLAARGTGRSRERRFRSADSERLGSTRPSEAPDGG